MHRPEPADPRGEQPPDGPAAASHGGEQAGPHHTHLVNRVVQLSWLCTPRDGTTYTLGKETQYKLLIRFNSCQ